MMTIDELMRDSIIHYNNRTPSLQYVNCRDWASFTAYIKAIDHARYKIVRIEVPENWHKKFKQFIEEL